MRRTQRRACLRVFLYFLAVGAASAALEVEHSVGGSAFRPAGKLVGDIPRDWELAWQRPALTSDELALIKETAVSDGLYSVRIKTDRGILLSSVPARCLLRDDFTEQVVLHANLGGFIEAFNYDVASCSSAAMAVDSAAGRTPGGGGGAGGRPEWLQVRVKLPAEGPMLSMPEAVGEFAEVFVDAAEAGGLGAAAFDPNAKPRAVPSAGAGGGGQGGSRKGGPPPKDERTWLQKNWLYVVAIGMMVINVLAKGQQQQGGPAAAAGGGGGGGGAARRG